MMFILITLIPQDGSTALHCAAASNHEPIIKLLLDPPHSCCVDFRSKFGETPLHMACLNGHLDTAKLLAEYKADLQAWDDKKNSILHHSAASDSYELINWIVTDMKCKDLLDSQNMVSINMSHIHTRILHCL